MDYLKTIGLVNNGSNGRGFANPYDTAHARDGRIFVLNRRDISRRGSIRVGICNFDEDYLGEFGYGQFVQPVAMAFDSQERLYITDEHNNRVSIFTSDGDFIHKWGAPGSGPGQMNGPSGIAIDADDNVYVADQHNHRVQRFSTDGEYIDGWGQHGSQIGSLDMPWGLAVDSRGDVFVADWRNDRVQKFSSEGAPLAVYGTPGRDQGQLSRPSAVAVDDQGLVYVADWGKVLTSAYRSSPPTALPYSSSEARPPSPGGPGTSSTPTPTSGSQETSRKPPPGPPPGPPRPPRLAGPPVLADRGLLLGARLRQARPKTTSLRLRDQQA